MSCRYYFFQWIACHFRQKGRDSMIYFSGISIRHLERWDFPDDDTPVYSSVDDCYRLFLGLHLKMMRFGHGEFDPYYNRYLACVKYFKNRLKLNYQEYRNVVANIVDLYQQYYKTNYPKKRQALLDTIGKFERLIYLFANKTPS